MNIIVSIVLFVVGLGLVIYFAEKLVKGAVGTSLGFCISTFLITVIFIGFDPENLAVGLKSTKEKRIIPFDKTIKIALLFFEFTFVNMRSGEEYVWKAEEEIPGIFPEGYFELRKKVKFRIPAEATAAKRKTFKSKWADTRDKFLLQPDQELNDSPVTFHVPTHIHIHVQCLCLC
jgi:hypothetical protein